MKVKSISLKILTILATLGFLLVICITAFLIPASSQSFYKKQFEKHDTLNKVLSQEYVVGIKGRTYLRTLDDEKLLILIDGVLDYCVGKTDTMQPKGANGELVELFNKQEVSHLGDVRRFFIGTFIAGGIGFAFFIAGLIIALVNKKFYYEHARRYPLYTLLAFAVLVLAIGVFAIIDFNKIFYVLHTLFFDGNFAFNYGVMINLIGDIFAPMAIISIPIIIGFIATFTVLIILYNRKLKKRFLVKKINQSLQETV